MRMKKSRYRSPEPKPRFGIIADFLAHLSLEPRPRQEISRPLKIMSVPTRQSAQAPSANRGRMHPELMRCFCCIGVVVGHCNPDLIAVAIAGVAGFLTISVHFALEATSRATLLTRALRATKLWLTWSAIYALVLVTRDLGRGRALGEGFEWWMVATGPSIHLWYLPALAVTLLVLSVAVSPCGVAPRSLRTLALFTGAAAVTALLSRLWQPWPLPKPFGQAAVAAFIACVAVAVHPLAKSLGRRAILFGWLMIAAGLAVQLFEVDSWVSFALIAVGTSPLCAAAQQAPGPLLIALASLTGGVYLCHMMFIAGLRFAGFNTAHWIPAVLIASAALTTLARRTRLAPLFP